MSTRCLKVCFLSFILVYKLLFGLFHKLRLLTVNRAGSRPNKERLKNVNNINNNNFGPVEKEKMSRRRELVVKSFPKTQQSKAVF